MDKRIWIWCHNEGVWLTITYIPGKMNVEAEKQSRAFNDRTEWRLNPQVFHELVKQGRAPDIDLFASRLNFQMKPFISWGPDPVIRC